MDKKYYKSKAIKEKYKKIFKQKKLIEKYNKKRKEDIINRIINNLSKRANSVLKKNKIKRNFTHMELIGCSKEFLKKYIENKLKIANKKQNDDYLMSLSNYSEWEIDHIKPISLYYLNNKEELLECFNYKNLQPLWKLDNRKKFNKYPQTDKVLQTESIKDELKLK